MCIMARSDAIIAAETGGRRMESPADTYVPPFRVNKSLFPVILDHLRVPFTIMSDEFDLSLGPGSGRAAVQPPSTAALTFEDHESPLNPHDVQGPPAHTACLNSWATCENDKYGG